MTIEIQICEECGCPTDTHIRQTGAHEDIIYTCTDCWIKDKLQIRPIPPSTIELATGLAFTGEYENGLPQFIGDKENWNKYEALNIQEKDLKTYQD